MSTAVLKVYVICAVVLYLKFFRVTLIQARKSFSWGGRAPEDSKLPLGRGKPKQNYGLGLDGSADEKMLAAKAAEHRWRHIVQNDLESIPFALLIFAGGVATEANSTVQIGVIIAYTVVRCLHTVAYAKELQPYRSICWLVSIIAILVGAGNAIAGAFTS